MVPSKVSHHPLMSVVLTIAPPSSFAIPDHVLEVSPALTSALLIPAYPLAPETLC